MITVVSATSFRIDQHALAIARTRAALPGPSEGLIISPVPPTLKPTSAWGRWEPIPECWIPRGIWDRTEYSRFIIRGLVDFIETSHALVVQWDGYGVHTKRWSDEFLQYDYIGAPWPAWMNIGRVGNGGFSLRSKRWLERAASPLSSPLFEDVRVRGSEDCYCCTVFRDFYLSAGLTVAPIGIAIRFSIEHPVDEFPTWNPEHSFGFHGFFHRGNERNRLPNL